MKLGVRMPHCIGLHDPGDKQCEGDPKGKTHEARVKCVYLDRCFALQRIVEKRGRPLDQFVVLKRSGPRVYAYSLYKNLVTEVQTLISDYRINGGVAAARRRNRPLKTFEKPAGKAESADAVKDVASWLFRRLAGNLGTRVEDVALVHPGELFMVNRLQTSNYQSLYLKTEKGRKALVSVYSKPRKSLVEVRIAQVFKDFEAAVSKKQHAHLAMRDYTGKDGAFNVSIPDVDKGKAGIIADTFAPLIKTKL